MDPSSALLGSGKSPSPCILSARNRPVRGRSIRETAAMPFTSRIGFPQAGLVFGTALLLCGSSLVGPAFGKPFMIVGLDEKVSWDDDGKTVLAPAGKDQVLIVDL